MLKLECVRPDEKYLKRAEAAAAALFNKTGKSAELTGWLEPRPPKDELDRIKAAAARVRRECGALVVLGIGGSSLGAKAALDFLYGPRRNELDEFKIYFAGEGFSARDTEEVLRLTEGRVTALCVVSKSGSTAETSAAFSIFEAEMKRRYGERARELIFVITGDRGPLFEHALSEGCERFTVPDDTGGRYSVLTPVGLFPLACAGVDTDALLAGAEEEREAALCGKSAAVLYAASRVFEYGKGAYVELFGAFEPRFKGFTGWLEQLFAESEGKIGQGIFPAGLSYTADLHSLGQYVQQGRRMLQESLFFIPEPESGLRVPRQNESRLAGKTLHEINEAAMKATAAAHREGSVPVRIFLPEGRDEKTLGGMIWFFEFACGVSGYMQGIDPFDQPGVENYKKRMRALLGETKSLDK